MNETKRKRERGGGEKEETGQTVRTLDVTAGLSFDWHSRSFERRLCRGESLPRRNDFSLFIVCRVTPRRDRFCACRCVALTRNKSISFDYRKWWNPRKYRRKIFLEPSSSISCLYPNANPSNGFLMKTT